MLSNIEYVISKVLKKLHLRAKKNSSIDKTSKIGAGTLFVNSRMDRNSFCGYDCIIINTKIGAFCSIAGNCEIGGASHTIDWVSTSPVFNGNKEQIKKKYSYHEFNPVTNTSIGNDVWIGAKCLIKGGIKIGDGAVIGMGSVVTKDIPPYEIWAGNPARLIRKRFDNETIDKIHSSKWWELDDEILTSVARYINDVPKFLEEVRK